MNSHIKVTYEDDRPWSKELFLKSLEVAWILSHILDDEFNGFDEILGLKGEINDN